MSLSTLSNISFLFITASGFKIHEMTNKIILLKAAFFHTSIEFNKMSYIIFLLREQSSQLVCYPLIKKIRESKPPVKKCHGVTFLGGSADRTLPKNVNP